MTKILFQNEEGFLEIVDSDRMYVDPDAPTDILIVVRYDSIKIRIRFSDTENVMSFMNVLFECDKINLYEIAQDNPELVVTVEPYDVDDMLESVNPESFLDYLYGLEDDEDDE